mmetsp:Transcript_10559/g.24830  ORF Transcript_10559/g.24830 Transcript_10559/m.24830 type:complete len:149 (-) Transcript_10559:111-557(-)
MRILISSMSLSAPVASDIAIRVALVLMIMMRGVGHILDKKGAFLVGKFTNGEKFYMKIPQGLEDEYEEDEILEMLVPIYGTKQAAMQFYKASIEVCRKLGYEPSKRVWMKSEFKWKPLLLRICLMKYLEQGRVSGECSRYVRYVQYVR